MPFSETDARHCPIRLAALCDTAIRDLAEVKTIGECLNIRNVMEAARSLGISRATVYRKLAQKPGKP